MKTTPKPPSPICSSSLYGPIDVPAAARRRASRLRRSVVPEAAAIQKALRPHRAPPAALRPAAATRRRRAVRASRKPARSPERTAPAPPERVLARACTSMTVHDWFRVRRIMRIARPIRLRFFGIGISVTQLAGAARRGQTSSRGRRSLARCPGRRPLPRPSGRQRSRTSTSLAAVGSSAANRSRARPVPAAARRLAATRRRSAKSTR